MEGDLSVTFGHHWSKGNHFEVLKCILSSFNMSKFKEGIIITCQVKFPLYALELSTISLKLYRSGRYLPYKALYELHSLEILTVWPTNLNFNKQINKQEM